MERVEILIHRRRAEVRPHLDDESQPKLEVLKDVPVEFTGPLADLKRFAVEQSRPGLRFYVRQRKTKGTPTIRVGVRRGTEREWHSFAAEDEARALNMVR